MTRIVNCDGCGRDVRTNAPDDNPVAVYCHNCGQFGSTQISPDRRLDTDTSSTETVEEMEEMPDV